MSTVGGGGGPKAQRGRAAVESGPLGLCLLRSCSRSLEQRRQVPRFKHWSWGWMRGRGRHWHRHRQGLKIRWWRWLRPLRRLLDLRVDLWWSGRLRVGRRSRFWFYFRTLQRQDSGAWFLFRNKQFHPRWRVLDEVLPHHGVRLLVWMAARTLLKNNSFDFKNYSQIKSPLGQPTHVEGWPHRGAKSLPWLFLYFNRQIMSSSPNFSPMIKCQRQGGSSQSVPCPPNKTRKDTKDKEQTNTGSGSPKARTPETSNRFRQQRGQPWLLQQENHRYHLHSQMGLF